MPHIPNPGIANLRDMFSRSDKDKPAPSLRPALSLLNLNSLDELEERVLTTTAFLAPWAAFRDTCLLVDKACTGETTNIARLDILWFYTQFDESLRRHDPRIEKPDAHFEIDKSGWSHVEHEKHLYAWLLQAFCVGKAYNPFRFQYFELRNVCTAWFEVFVPIVNAVRASYSVKGRKHYGRLALFIEDRCPSRLAFPEGNLSLPHGVINSPTPFRLVSKPTHLRSASQTVLTKKNYDDAEKELRDVYPQYGGLVERPRFQQKMEEWLEIQRVRAAHRKTIAKPDLVQYVSKYQPQVVQGHQQNWRSRSPTTTTSEKKGSSSPIKQYAESIRRSLSFNTGNKGMGRTEPQSPLSPTRPKTPTTPKIPMIPYGKYSYVPKILREVPKSPLHGVTRKIEIPDDEYEDERDTAGAWPLPATHLPRPKLPEQRLSMQSMYTTIRHSSPFSQDTPSHDTDSKQQTNTDIGDTIWSPMGAPSAIPQPLKKTCSNLAQRPQPLPGAETSVTGIRHPSYEGNDYQDEISLTNLQARGTIIGDRSVDTDVVPPKPRSNLPAPIKMPPPYISQRHAASTEPYCSDTWLKPATAARVSNRLQPTAGSIANNRFPTLHTTDSNFVPPPIPVKSPERWASRRSLESQRYEQVHTSSPQSMIHPALRENGTEHNMLRIVSKENIRAALSNLTPESSIEDLRAARTKVSTRVASPPRLETYNSHMFPRKDASR